MYWTDYLIYVLTLPWLLIRLNLLRLYFCRPYLLWCFAWRLLLWILLLLRFLSTLIYMRWAFIWTTINGFFLAWSYICWDTWTYTIYWGYIISASLFIRHLFTINTLFIISSPPSQLLYPLKPLFLLLKYIRTIHYDAIHGHVIINRMKPLMLLLPVCSCHDPIQWILLTVDFCIMWMCESQRIKWRFLDY